MDVYLLIELRLQVRVDKFSVMSGFYPERERERVCGGRGKKNEMHLKAPSRPNLPQVKQISSCQQTNYDRAISLKAAAGSVQSYHPQHGRLKEVFAHIRYENLMSSPIWVLT